MDHPQFNWIANFIWGVADDVLRDLYVRGKYRDVILPMTVLRRLDSLLEPSKPAVLAMAGWRREGPGWRSRGRTNPPGGDGRTVGAMGFYPTGLSSLPRPADRICSLRGPRGSRARRGFLDGPGRPSWGDANR